MSLILALLRSLWNDDAEERKQQREKLLLQMRAYASTCLSWSFRLTLFVVCLIVLFATATVLYGMVYYLVIPSRLHEQEIFFNYGSSHASLVKDGQFTFPTAQLNLLDAEHAWTPGPSMKSTPVASHVLVPGVKYDVIIELIMPESRMNVEQVGMFMVETVLASHTNKILASSQRPAIVKPSHPIIDWVRIICWFIPYVLRLSEPSQSISFVAINGIEESKLDPLTTVSIVLNHPQIEIYQAKLTIIAQLSGVRYLMYHWSLLTALIAVLNLVFLQLLGILVLYAMYHLQLPEELNIKEEEKEMILETKWD